MITWNEKDIEDYLFDNPWIFKFGYGDYPFKWVARQYSLPSGKLDLLGKTDSEIFFVVEIKNVTPDSSAIAQVCRYATDIEQILYAANPYDADIKKIIKYIVYPQSKWDKIQNNVIFEANAMNVHMVGFSVGINIEMPVVVQSEASLM